MKLEPKQLEYNKHLTDIVREIGMNPKKAYTKRQYVKSGKHSKRVPIVRTLRDDFALSSLPPLIERLNDLEFAKYVMMVKTGTVNDYLAETAYQYADAMLVARNKGAK